MLNNQNPNRKFDLEERTTNFARKVVVLCRDLPKDAINYRLVGQVVGCSGSIGANYRKEAKEAAHWLALLSDANPRKSVEIKLLENEAVEYKNILSAILNKTV